jgi:histidinol dehydrogenase
MIRIIDGAGGELFARRQEKRQDVSGAVSEIIAEVRARGDAALYGYTKRFDGAELETLEVTAKEREAALEAVPAEFLRILRRAAENIRTFHSRQCRQGYEIQGENGTVLGQKLTPLHRVGLYIPGGTACYPSSVLMNCIPAKLAGVPELIMATPPRADGSVAPDILAAAQLGGVDRIFKMGGAQAVAALAYGTESVPAVDKIVGPGNAFVAEAKRQVFGQVAIDMIAGPSEILVIADDKADAAVVAADLLSQAEHDKNAAAVLATPSRRLAEAVAAELEAQIPRLPRAEIARASIEENGRILITDSIEAAIELGNAVAPEHLELLVDEPFRYLDDIRNAGSVFLGRYCPEALGDYMSGTNHVLPTGGTARFSSPLGVDDFLKRSQYSYYTADALSNIYADVAYFADREGLHAHALSALARSRQEEEKNE